MLSCHLNHFRVQRFQLMLLSQAAFTAVCTILIDFLCLHEYNFTVFQMHG